MLRQDSCDQEELGAGKKGGGRPNGRKQAEEDPKESLNVTLVSSLFLTEPVGSFGLPD